MASYDATSAGQSVLVQFDLPASPAHYQGPTAVGRYGARPLYQRRPLLDVRADRREEDDLLPSLVDHEYLVVFCDAHCTWLYALLVKLS